MSRVSRTLTVIFAVTAGLSPLMLTGTSQAAGPRLPERALGIVASWHRAVPVPGVAALNTGGVAQGFAMSCTTAGNCGVGGDYSTGTPSNPVNWPFVTDEVNGTWRHAEEVPGITVLDPNGGGIVDAMSCRSPGNCSAVGDYTNGSPGAYAPFLVSEVHGTWRNATKVPGMARLNPSGDSVVAHVSCSSAGNCSATGYYIPSPDKYEVFVVNEVNGTWHTAMNLPGIAALNTGGIALPIAISCPAPGSCGVGGYYTGSGGGMQAFVASEINGTWHTATKVPGTAALNVTGGASTDALSCASAGNCSAAGIYGDAKGITQLFVASEINGTWRKAIQLPGTAALNKGNPDTGEMSCPAPGNCALAGWYGVGTYPAQQAFVASEVNGTWRKAIEVPGTATLNAGTNAQANSVSCSTAGNCSSFGYYTTDASGHSQAFVADEINGVWRNAIQVPGTGALNAGKSVTIGTVSCGASDNCSLTGSYDDGANLQVFVASKS